MKIPEKTSATMAFRRTLLGLQIVRIGKDGTEMLIEGPPLGTESIGPRASKIGYRLYDYKEDES